MQVPSLMIFLTGMKKKLKKIFTSTDEHLQQVFQSLKILNLLKVLILSD